MTVEMHPHVVGKDDDDSPSHILFLDLAADVVPSLIYYINV